VLSFQPGKLIFIESGRDEEAAVPAASGVL